MFVLEIFTNALISKMRWPVLGIDLPRGRRDEAPADGRPPHLHTGPQQALLQARLPRGIQ